MSLTIVDSPSIEINNISLSNITLNNYLISDIKYILLTSHLNTENKFENRNIVTGDFRKIDLFSKAKVV